MSYSPYTGVGSRSTPQAVLDEMCKIGRMFAAAGWTLRSGHADGADMAFERGCDSRYGDKEVYLPWFRFNGSNSRLHHIPEWAFQEANDLHPKFQYLKLPLKKLHARNVLQVMGLEAGEPGQVSRVVVCWTPNGDDVGGTATAIRLARYLEVPIINMALDGWQGEIRKYLSGF